uniref:Transposase Tc1-like domain-containing protein n=1 Tax=Sinocyclocheilus grahami TaxID=75366 RepID=A0A672N3S4_SINGR
MRTIKAVKTNKSGVHGNAPRRKPQLYKQNTTACLRFAKLHLDDPCGYWKNLIRSHCIYLRSQTQHGILNCIAF